MSQYTPNPIFSENRTLANRLALLTLFVLLGSIVSTPLTQAFLVWGGFETDPTANLRTLLLVKQAFVASSALIIAPTAYWHFVEKQPASTLFAWPQSYLMPTLLTIGLIIALMVVNTWVIAWNSTVQLPYWLHTFEEWAQRQEATQQRLTTLLTTFPTLKALLVGLIVMGFIPAIGEELLFRGLIQNLLHQHWRNPHLAISVSALIFSIVHCQFYGLVPRWLLGMLLGYIYWWTRDLTFPMLAHWCNNALTLLLLFLHQQRLTNYDITTAEVPSGPIWVVCVALVIALAWRLRQMSTL